MAGAFGKSITAGLADALNQSVAAAAAQPTTGVMKLNTAGGVQMEVAALREKVKELTAAGEQGELMNPDDIHLSPLANRHEMSFLTPKFKALCDEIAATGGNVQPIGVVKQEDGRIELVFGHRRRRACKHLGLKVRVIRIPGPISQEVLMQYMHAENTAREDLTVYEQGCWYHEALEQKVYSTATELAQSLGITDAWVSKTLQVARLPQDVIKAFPNPLEITSKMGDALTMAIKRDHDGVLYRAMELMEPPEEGKAVEILTAQQVFMRLMFEGGESRAEPVRTLKIGAKAKPYAKVKRDDKGRIHLTLAEGFNWDESKKIEAFIKSLAEAKKAFQEPEPKAKKKPGVKAKGAAK